MQFRSLLAFAAGVVYVAAKPVVDHEAHYVEDTKMFWKRQDPVKPCSDLHVIAISGDGKDNKGSTGDLNVTYSALKTVVPDTTHRNLPYPKGSPNKLASTVVGAGNLERWLKEYNNACPKTKIALVGYSAGGIIAMNTLCGASEYPWPSSDPLAADYPIIATIIFGDETFVSGQPWDVGSCKGQGRFPRQNNAACDAYAAGIKSYCVAADPQCCLGDDGSAHFVYPTKYGQNVIDWVKHRYEVTTKSS